MTQSHPVVPDSSRNMVYFISDLHLGASYIPDHQAHERLLVRWLDFIMPSAKQLYLLGDVLDYWYEYKHVVPQGYVRFFGKLAELADAGVEIFWMTGNHDVWLFNYLRHEIGFTLLKKPLLTHIDGVEFFMAHGDNVGYQPLLYRFMRTCFYSPLCQWLYAGIHPRWTVGFATGWSAHNRTTKHYKPTTHSRAYEALLAFTQDHAKRHPGKRYYLYGHLHIVKHEFVTADAHITVLGDWLTHFTYAVWDGQALQLCSYDPGHDYPRPNI